MIWTLIKKFVQSGEHQTDLCRKIESFFDSKEFELIKTPVPKDDPLNFVDKKNIPIV